MLKDENTNQQPNNSENYWLILAVLLICVFFLNAKPVPFGNEFPYLLRLARQFQPDFLLNDWTFSAPANEHWLFNHSFGFLASFIKIEILAWFGRVLSWFLILRGLLQLGKLWNISYASIAISILMWLAIGQSLVGHEWMMGGFEAKSVAYFFLLMALYNFANQKIIIPAAMLGIAFAFHPAIGFWSSLAVGLALFFEKIGFKKLIILTSIISLLALIGILPIIFDQFCGQEENFEIWKFMVTIKFPYHFDPFDFSRSYTILLITMLVMNCVVFYKSEHFRLRFLLKFQIALGIFFIAAFVLRWYEMYTWLRFLPVRLFPVFTPLFFTFTTFWALTNLKSKSLKLAIVLFVVFSIFWLNPIYKGFTKVEQTYTLWQAPLDDLHLTSLWIAKNTPKGSIIIQPPHRRELWYLSQRAHIVSYVYPTFGRLVEWRERVADLTNSKEIKSGENDIELIENAYNNLSAEEIKRISIKYKATYLVSRKIYIFPIVFQTATYRVYLLPMK